MDALTGLAAIAELPDVWAQAAGPQERCPALLVDIDAFSGINYELGWRAGDDALVRLARWLETAAAERGARVVRVGGEEFAVLPGGADVADAVAFATRLVGDCPGLAIPYAHPQSPRRVLTVSAAVFVAGPELAASLAPVRDQLGTRIYQAKQAEGRDHAVVAV